MCVCAGASVISTRCSETYRIRSACVTLFGFPLWYPSESPRTVIQVSSRSLCLPEPVIIHYLPPTSIFFFCLFSSASVSIPLSKYFLVWKRVCITQSDTNSFLSSLPTGLPVAAPREMLGVSRRPGDSCDLSVSPHHDNSRDAGPPAALQLPHWPHWLRPQRLWSLCEWSQSKDESPWLMNVVHALYSDLALIANTNTAWTLFKWQVQSKV